MTQEQKQLLLQDLCARLPYTPQVVYNGITETLSTLHIFDMTHLKEEYVDIKPYLRPLSSMTFDETNVYDMLYPYDSSPSPLNISKITDWFHKHHFDYRGLIDKGLALPAPKDMYNF